MIKAFQGSSTLETVGRNNSLRRGRQLQQNQNRAQDRDRHGFLCPAGTEASTAGTTCSTVRRGRWCSTSLLWPSSTTGCSTASTFTWDTMMTSSASPSTHSKTTWPQHRYSRPIRAQHFDFQTVYHHLSVPSGGQRPGDPRLGRPNPEVSVTAQRTPQQRSVCFGLYRWVRWFFLPHCSLTLTQQIHTVNRSLGFP